MKEVLKELDFSVQSEEVLKMKKEASDFISLLRSRIKKGKIAAEIFVGGSFGKETMIQSDLPDIDIFVRFDKKYENLSAELRKLVRGLGGSEVHGSRDYYRFEKGRVVLEVVPVLKIKKVSEARNVTDLSYFHVGYVRKKLNRKLRKEISLAKRFCKAQRVYGAESYIRGFSGYALECLIIYYKSFEKMLKELIKIRKSEKKIIDPEKHFKRKGDVLVEINQSKTLGPIVLVDPTWKERNVLSALDWETFESFQIAARKFLKCPSRRYFSRKRLDIERLKKKKGEFVHIVLETDRQAGDIAGTKMKKVSKYLVRETQEYFKIVDSEFDYLGEQTGDLYLVLKPLKKVVRRGPPLTDRMHFEKFSKKNEDVFVKNNRAYAKIHIKVSGREFLERVSKKECEKIRSMGIKKIEVIS